MSDSSFDDFVPLNTMDLVITDLIVLNKKEKVPQKYVVVEPAISEGGGRLSFGKRYLAYTREVPNRMGRVALTDIKVINSGDKPTAGYRPLPNTFDDNSNSFSSKLILVKIEPFEEAREAVSEVIVLSGSKRENVPNDYRRLPEVHGFSICFSKQKVNNTAPPTSSTNQPNTSGSGTTGSTGTPAGTMGMSSPGGGSSGQKKPRSAIDGITFKLRDSKGVDTYLNQFLLPDLQLLSFDELQEEFKFNWDLVDQQLKT